MQKTPMEKLGIIGGLGPAATARLMTRIVDFTDAHRDQDHLDITVLNRPWIPDRTAYLLGRPGAASFIEPMQQAALELERAGCTVLCTPCNTAHSRLDDIAAPLADARFVHMPASTADVAARLGCASVAVLATEGTRAAGVYDRALEAAGVAAVWPDEDVQHEVTSIIYDEVKAGRVEGSGRHVEAVCSALVSAGCDGIILGCTELSVVDCPRTIAGVPAVDALDVLAWRCVSACGAPAYDLEAAFAVATD